MPNENWKSIACFLQMKRDKSERILFSVKKEIKRKEIKI